jgi:hypothetical protein
VGGKYKGGKTTKKEGGEELLSECGGENKDAQKEETPE